MRRLHKTLVVSASVENAFRAWTEHIGTWWPPNHVPFGSRVDDVRFEALSGGSRLLMDTPEGTFVLGRVTACRPPEHLAYDFYVGSSEAEPSRVVVRFVAMGANTRVEMEHARGAVPVDVWEGNVAGYASAWEGLVSALAKFFEEGT